MVGSARRERACGRASQRSRRFPPPPVLHLVRLERSRKGTAPGRPKPAAGKKSGETGAAAAAAPPWWISPPARSIACPHSNRSSRLLNGDSLCPLASAKPSPSSAAAQDTQSTKVCSPSPPRAPGLRRAEGQGRSGSLPRRPAPLAGKLPPASTPDSILRALRRQYALRPGGAACCGTRAAAARWAHPRRPLT
jgi:hypothetical protein